MTTPAAAHPIVRLWRDVVADYAQISRYRAKYHGEALPVGRLPVDLVQKIGFQMAAMVRVMHCAKRLRVPLGPQVVSRLIRHLYGGDIHWDADIAPGLSLIHGIGVIVSHGAHISEGCILFQNVTLGEGIDPHTRAIGAPHLEQDVHVGPGATLIGPIVVGRGSTVMAGAVLAESVPPGTLVTPAPAVIRARRPAKGAEA